ncbi:unnamed protein product [Leuciscus chuanchicus]
MKKSGSGTTCAVVGCKHSRKHLNEWLDRECYDHKAATKMSMRSISALAIHGEVMGRLLQTVLQIQSPELGGRPYESVVGHRRKAKPPNAARSKKVVGHGGGSLQPSPLIIDAVLKERVFTAVSGSDLE